MMFSHAQFPFWLADARNVCPDCFVLYSGGGPTSCGSRLTMYREPGESDANLWDRVLREWDELNKSRGSAFVPGGRIECRYDKKRPPPGSADEDWLYNFRRAMRASLCDPKTSHAEKIKAGIWLGRLCGALPWYDPTETPKERRMTREIQALVEAHRGAPH